MFQIGERIVPTGSFHRWAFDTSKMTTSAYE